MSTAPTLTALQAGTLAAIGVDVPRTGKGRHKTKEKEERTEPRKARPEQKARYSEYGPSYIDVLTRHKSRV